MIKKAVEDNYGIVVEGIVKISEKAYKIFANNQIFLLKRHQDEYIENIFVRLKMLGIDTFLLPEMTIIGNYLFFMSQNVYALYHYYEDENLLNKDIRLHFYIKSLAQLHLESKFPMNVNDGFYIDKLDYIQKRIDDVDKKLITRIKRVEREDYHSPADWYFFMNYQHLHLGVNQAKRYLDKLDEEYKVTKDLHLCLTYQNFDFRHIIVKAQKILSLDKMAISSPINDLLFFFEENVINTIDVSSYLKEYFAINPLEKYEIYELMAMLFIPNLKMNNGQKEDIFGLSQTIISLERAEKLATFISENFLASESEK